MRQKSKLKVGVFGNGSFGSFISEVFTKGLPDIQLYSYDAKAHSEAALDSVLKCDVVILAVPFNAYPHLLKTISSRLDKNTVVMDVCSVKVKPKNDLNKYLSKHKNLLITHPLFGPQSVKNFDIKGQTLIVTDVIGSKAEDFLDFIETNLRPKIVAISADEHDRVMAQVHALTFFVAKGLGDLGLKEIPFRTPSYKMITDMVLFDKSHSADLYDTIQAANPYAEEIREAFITSLQKAHSRDKKSKK